MALLFEITLGLLPPHYIKTVNKKYAHNYVCYLTHGRLGVQRKAHNRNAGLKLKHAGGFGPV